jgi:FKBP-type peptidyl-prolyl cis-trans isomerase FklB
MVIFMDTTKEKVSYCIGLQTGRNLLQQFVDLDVNRLTEGFQDSLIGNFPKLSNEEVQQVMTSLRQQVESQQKQFIAKLAEDNKKAGEAFLTENKNKQGVITLTSGLQYKVLKSGSGATPQMFDVVTAHYQGSFLDGRVFDSSYQRGKPQSFPVNQVIQGWAEALQLMKVGDKWQLFIPSYLAYGEAGFRDVIAPNSTLVFEMELTGINEAG